MEKTTFISFPGLGIGEFRVNNVAFTLFGHNIMWYGIIITLGIVLAYFYVCYRAKHNENVRVDDVIDYAIYLVVFGCTMFSRASTPSRAKTPEKRFTTSLQYGRAVLPYTAGS